MKKFLLVGSMAVLLPSFAQQENGIDTTTLSGDVKLACEAILCLSSGTRPSECSPSLNRYFSIRKKTTSKTIRARENFLSQCPVVSESSEMRARVGQIARGAGRCDAAFLNTQGEMHCVATYRGKERRGGRALRASEGWSCASYDLCGNVLGCAVRQVFVVSNTLPAYCSAYQDSHLADVDTLGVRYVGEPMNGGRWEDK